MSREGRVKGKVIMGSRPKDVADDIDELHKLSISWIPNRQKCCKQLLERADEMNKHQKNVDIAKVTGLSAVIAGTGLAIGGVVAAIPTGGASLIAYAAGVGFVAAGGATAAGADIIKKLFLDEKIYREVQESINRDQKITKKIHALIDKLKVSVESLRERDIEESNEEYLELEAAVNSTYYAASLGQKIVYDLLNTATTRNVPVFRSLSTLVKVVHFPFGEFESRKDEDRNLIYILVQSAIDLDRGTVSGAEKKIRDIAEQMTCPDEAEVPGIMRADVL